MEIALSKVNYAKVSVLLRKCMKLPPLGNKDVTNKIAIADSSGTFKIFASKNYEIYTQFSLDLSSPPTVLVMGGKAKDKIFIATSDGKIFGFTKKGKQIFELKTEIAGPIKSMYIEGTDIFVSGDFTFLHYKESQEDIQSFICSEKIADIICLPSEKMSGLVPIIACCDRTLKVLKESNVQAEIQISGVPQCLCLFGNDGGATGDRVLYGTVDGRLGLAKLNRFLQEIVWELDPPPNRDTSGISCISNFDVTCNGYLDIIIGRDDGWVEIYELDELEQPVLKYSSCLNESITAIEGGNVGSSDFIEVVCSTYSGWVFGLTTEPIKERKSKSSLMLSNSHAIPVNFVDKIKEDPKIPQLKKEVEELQKKIEEEREKYKRDIKKPGQMSVIPTIYVNDRFIFNTKDGEYLLTLETQAPIEYILLQCDVPLNITDCERNHAIVSFTPCLAEEGNGLLATFRCQASVTRLDIKVRPLEGQRGVMRAYVTPRIQPKVCQVKMFTIKPLSLHYRIHEIDDTRPFNKLRLAGNFDLSDMHSWIDNCLPEIPENLPSGDIRCFNFVSASLGTMLQCSYRDGEVNMRSENISTISILKNNLTRMATNQGIKLDISFELNDPSVVYVLSSVLPKINDMIVLSKKVQLLDPLKELSVQEGSSDFLSKEFQDMLKDADELVAQHQQQGKILEHLYGIITNLYVDWYKFKGQSVKDKLPKLMSVMKKHNINELVQFFQESIDACDAN